MKKIVSVLLVLILIFSAAQADDISTFIAKWNSYSKHYCAPTLSEDIYSKGVFTGDGWKLVITEIGGKISSAGVLAEDMDLFVPLCIQAGILMVGDYTASDLIKYIGDITYMYLSAKSDEWVPVSIFGIYMFKVEKKSEGYFFAIGEI